MARVELIMPKMGESIMEATILNWLKKPGDKIEQDESVLEVATDKVDTEVPSTHEGVLVEILAKEGEVVKVGKAIAIISTEVSEAVTPSATAPATRPSAKETNSQAVVCHCSICQWIQSRSRLLFLCAFLFTVGEKYCERRKNSRR